MSIIGFRHVCGAAWRRLLTPGITGVAIACTAAAVTAQEPSSATVTDLIRSAVTRFEQTAPGAQAPSPVTESASGPPLSLALTQATQMALDRNLEISARRLDAQTFELALRGAQAIYRPSLSALLGDQRQTPVPVTLLTGGRQVTTQTATFDGALTQNLTRGGGSVQVAWNNNRVSSNSFFSNYNPAYNTTFAAQLTQPLLRGLHFDAARRQIAVAAIDRGMSEAQVRATVTNTLVEVRHAYWNLVLATQSIEVAQSSVTLATQLVEENRKRVQAGTMTSLDLVTAESQAANDAHELVVAQGNARTAELALKRLLATGADDPIWKRSIVPADRPDDRPASIDLESALRRALAERTDVALARQQTAANDATLAYLRDQTRPQADVVASYAIAGLGGAQLIRATGDNFNAFTAPVIGTTPGAFGSALSSLGSWNYPTWGFALNVTYPIGYSAAKAEAARAEILAKEASAQQKALEVQVVNDVTAAAIQVRNAFDEIGTTRQAADMSARRVDAEQKKFTVGLSTNYLIVQAERDLGDARRAVLQAEIAYQNALVDFDRAQQTTLQSAGVTIVAPSGVGTAPVGSGRSAQPAPSGSFF